MPDVDELIQQLNDTRLYYYRRVDALKALARLGDDRAAASLMGVLGDQEKYVRREAVLALGRLGAPEAVAPIARVLAEDEDDEARRNAARALSEFATPGALAAVEAALEDNSWSVRYAAKNAAKKIGDALPEAVPAAEAEADAPQPTAEAPPVESPEPPTVDVPAEALPEPEIQAEDTAPPEPAPAPEVEVAEPPPAQPPAAPSPEPPKPLLLKPTYGETPTAVEEPVAGETDEGKVEEFLESHLRTGETVQAIAQSSRDEKGRPGRAWLAVTDQRAILIRPATDGASSSALVAAHEHDVDAIAGTEFLNFIGPDGAACTRLFLLSAGRQPLDAVTLAPSDRAEFEDLAESIEALRRHAVPPPAPSEPAPPLARPVLAQPARVAQPAPKAPKLYTPVKPGAPASPGRDAPEPGGGRPPPPLLSPAVARLESSMAAMRKEASGGATEHVSGTAVGDKQIRLGLEKRIYGPGETVVGKVTVNTVTRLAVRGVRFRIRGQEKTSISRGSGNSRTTYHGKHVIIDKELTLFGEEKHGFVDDVGDALMTLLGKAEHAELRSGAHPYPLSSELPQKALPTYSGKNAEVKYDMCAYIDIPAGFDVAHRRSLVVLPPQPLCQAAQGRQGSLDQPDGRIALAAAVNETAWQPGATLSGTVSFENPTRRAVRAVIISFVCHEQARAGGRGRTVTSESDTSKTWTRVALLADEQSVRDREFALQIPMGPPPFRGEWCQVSWFVEVRLDVPWARDIKVRIPIRLKKG